MLDLGFSENKISALLDNFFFHSFQGETKGKMLKNCQNYTLVFEFFSFCPPLKLCKKELSKRTFLRFQKILNPAFVENFSRLSHWKVKNHHPLNNLG
jgi:hypothetical protein